MVRSQKASSIDGFESSECNGQEYPSNSNFETSLKYAIAKLLILTPGTQDFNKYESSPDGAFYGHAVCHYQSNHIDCINCLYGAAIRLLELCPRQIGDTRILLMVPFMVMRFATTNRRLQIASLAFMLPQIACLSFVLDELEVGFCLGLELFVIQGMKLTRLLTRSK
nr:antifungal protein ginkbilobin-2-like [Ipomoea batatas]